MQVYLWLKAFHIAAATTWISGLVVAGLAVASRLACAGIQGRRLELTAATAQLQGATLHYAAVPAAYPHMDAFDFRAATMRPLFSYADQCAQAGRLWTAFQHTDEALEMTATATRRVRVPLTTRSSGILPRAEAVVSSDCAATRYRPRYRSVVQALT